MWIRSQNKDALVYANSFYIIKSKREEIYEISYFDGDSFVKLGFYKSKERALEVLDDIENKIMMNKVIEIFSNLGDMAQANRENYTYTPIYQMPKE